MGSDVKIFHSPLLKILKILALKILAWHLSPFRFCFHSILTDLSGIDDRHQPA